MGEVIVGALMVYFWMHGKAVKKEVTPELPEPTPEEAPEPEVQVTEERLLPGYVAEESREWAPGFLRGVADAPVWSGTAIPRVTIAQKEWIAQIDP